MKAEHIEPANFTAVRPTGRAVAELYLKQLQPGARISGDPAPIDAEACVLLGATHRIDFTAISGEPMALYLGQPATGGWQVKAKLKFVDKERAVA
jgi:hypothetical protein